MEAEEFQKLMKVCEGDEDLTRVFILMGFGGLRTIEVTQAVVKDLDRSKRGLWVLTAKQKKDPITRFIPLGEWYGMFEEATKNRKLDSSLVLFRGEPITRRQVRYYFHRAKKAAGIRGVLGPHSTRHLAGIVRTEAGGQPQEVAAFLGHKTLDMVLVYANLRRERNEQMASDASRILFGPRGQRGKAAPRKEPRH
jgi:integrase